MAERPIGAEQVRSARVRFTLDDCGISKLFMFSLTGDIMLPGRKIKTL